MGITDSALDATVEGAPEDIPVGVKITGMDG
jgi:hypothetical protein